MAVWKGIAAGMVGGLVGAWTMNQFQAALAKATEAMQDGRDSGQGKPQGDDATMKAASALSRAFAGRALTKSEKQVAGPIVHYAFGSIMGALYGAAAELAPSAAMGGGVPFGVALWAGADEVGVAAAGLSDPPAEVPLSTHASALAAHLMYGAGTDAVRRLIRAKIIR